MTLTRTRASALVLLALLAGATTAIRATRQATEEPQPWTAGHCYQVTIIYPEQQHTLRVVEAPRGNWVRVHSDPRLPSVPGASVRQPVWLNTASVFTLREVDCSTAPRE